MTTATLDLAPEPVSAVPLSMAELLELTALGDREAFGALYDQLSPRVFGLILRVVVNRALAEETMQEVFLEVWQKAGAFDRTRGAGQSWVMTIAHHRAVDQVRVHERAAIRDFDAGVRDLLPDSDHVARHMDDTDRARELRDALATLSDKQRRVLSLAYFDGHSQTEIAALTGSPLGTVKTATRDALIRLRKQLATV